MSTHNLLLFFLILLPTALGWGSEQAAEPCLAAARSNHNILNAKVQQLRTCIQALKYFFTASGLRCVAVCFQMLRLESILFFSGWLIGFFSDILEESFHSNYLAVRRCDTLSVFSFREEEIMLGHSWNYALLRQNEVLEPILNCWIN